MLSHAMHLLQTLPPQDPRIPKNLSCDESMPSEEYCPKSPDYSPISPNYNTFEEALLDYEKNEDTMAGEKKKKEDALVGDKKKNEDALACDKKKNEEDLAGKRMNPDTLADMTPDNSDEEEERMTKKRQRRKCLFP